MRNTTKLNILISIYSILATVYLLALINNYLNNLHGNRALGALLVFLYFSIMAIGLIKFRHFFSILSAFNFVIFTGAIVWILYIIFPKISIFYIALLIQYLSQKHIRKKEKEAWNNSIIKNQKNQKLFHERNHNTTKPYSTYN